MTIPAIPPAPRPSSSSVTLGGGIVPLDGTGPLVVGEVRVVVGELTPLLELVDVDVVVVHLGGGVIPAVGPASDS